MNVLYLSKEFPPNVYGGAGVHLKNLVEAMLCSCKSIVPKVICYGSDAPNVRPPLEVYPVPFEQQAAGVNREYADIQSHLKWANEVLSLNVDFDIIHCHTWHSLLPGILLKQLTGKPLVITCHSIDIKRPWKRDALGMVYNYSRWIEKAAYTEADAIIAVSETVKKDIKTYFSPSAPVYTIYNGADHLLIPTSLNTAAGDVVDWERVHAPYVLFLGRLTDQKGLDHFLDAAEMAIGSGIQFVVCAGQADSAQIELAYQQRCSALQEKEAAILWLRNVYHPAVKAKLYEAATAYVNPSVYEPFGLTVAEALAVGAPVILSDVCGISELLTDGADCAMVPYTENDRIFSKQLYDRIMEVATSEELRQKLSKKGKETFSTLPTWRECALCHQHVYTTAIRK